MLHVCGVTHDGSLWHTIRLANPTWLPFVNVQSVSTNVPTPFANVSLAQGSDTLNVCAQANGILWHTSRFSLPPPQFSLKLPRWQPTFDNVSEQAGKPGAFGSIGCGDLNGTLHACGVTDDGKLWHTFRTSTNPSAWHPFENLTTVVGNPGHFVFACVANSTPPPSFGGGDPTCNQIQACIGNDSLQIQALQAQEANTNNQAAIAQMNQQIAGLQQDIASLQQQAQQHNCP
jgi:hypothetical protein